MLNFFQFLHNHTVHIYSNRINIQKVQLSAKHSSLSCPANTFCCTSLHCCNKTFFSLPPTCKTPPKASAGPQKLPKQSHGSSPSTHLNKHTERLSNGAACQLGWQKQHFYAVKLWNPSHGRHTGTSRFKSCQCHSRNIWTCDHLLWRVTFSSCTGVFLEYLCETYRNVSYTQYIQQTPKWEVKRAKFLQAAWKLGKQTNFGSWEQGLQRGSQHTKTAG